MFGRRADGRAAKKIDPIIGMTPLLMKDRSDAQVFVSQDYDWNRANAYIKRKRDEGIKITHMAIVIAAFVRAVSQRPEINRFVVNKRIYVRKDLTVSFAILKSRTVEEVVETTVKLHFNPDETIFSVAEKVNRIIEEESKYTSESDTDKVARAIFKIPLLPRFAVSILMFMDRIGILPKAIIEASPFHTSLFLTNMASINMPAVYHHCYNFGTTSMFLGMGKKAERVTVDRRGVMNVLRVMPLNIVIDERIAAGATYAMALHLWESYMRHPELLEPPPESVRWDGGIEYHND